jgi:arylsulfatase A-like enzyme
MRPFARTLIPLVAGLSLALTVAAKPNILFILVDDQRHDELSCAGESVLQTPVIDSLAARGIRFENAFVTTSICAASRASIFTGLTERTHGYTFGKPPIRAEDVAASYPVLLRKAGYRTGFYGKFGVRLAKGVGTGEMFDDFQSIGGPGLRKQPDGTLRHSDELIGDQAVAFIRQQSGDQPFCLSISFNIAHARDGDKRPGSGHFPWPQSANELYQTEAMPLPRLRSPQIFEAMPSFLRKSMNRDRYFWRWDTPEKYDANMRGRFRMLTGMDSIVARMLKALEEGGLADNTVVIYTADNGYYRAERGFAGKWSHFEQSQRVPLIIYDPRSPKALQGRLSATMALNIDLPSTMLDLAGLDRPDSWQGRSLKPILDGVTPETWREDFFCEHLMGNRSIPMWEGVRGTRFKYARYFQQSPPYEFLHDLKADPDELRNLIDDPEYAPVLANLRQRCDEYVTTYSRPDQAAAPASRSPQMQQASPDDAGVYRFTGNNYALLQQTPALSAEDSFTWRFEVRVLPGNSAGAVLLGNRQTPGKRELTFMKVTAERGVQLFGGSQGASLRLPCTLPTNTWTTVELRKIGPEIQLSLDGKIHATGKAPFALAPMPCYLGGDPNVPAEAARCEIRKAFAGPQR